MSGHVSRSAYETLAAESNIDRSLNDIDELAVTEQDISFVTFTLMEALYGYLDGAGHRSFIPDATGAIDSYYKRILKYIEKRAVEGAWKSSGVIPGDGMDQYLTQWQGKYTSSNNKNNTDGGKTALDIQSLQEMLGIDRILAIACAQIDADGKGVSGGFLAESINGVATVTAPKSPKVSAFPGPEINMGSNAATQYVFFATPFIDIAGSYTSSSSSYNASTTGKDKTVRPVLAVPRPFKDGASSTIFDMRNIARSGFGAASPYDATSGKFASSNDYVEWNAGGGSDRGIMGIRSTLFNGGGDVGAKTPLVADVDIADYGSTFETITSPDGQSVANGGIVVTSGAGDAWAVKKSGTAVFQLIVQKSKVTKSGKSTNTIYYYTTEAVSKHVENYTDMLHDVEVVSATSSADLFVLETATGGDAAQIALGQGGNDTFVGVFNDTVIGGDGDDTVRGSDPGTLRYPGVGASYVDGGSGNDSILMQNGFNTLIGGSGNDTIYGGIGRDMILGDLATGDAIEARLSCNDVLDGDGGDDTIFGGAGDDSISGGDGADIILGGDGKDMVDGGEGSDQLSGDDGDDWVGGSKGNDILSGGNGNDFLAGGTDDDSLYGDAGDDTLSGDDGADLLVGGTGRNDLRGGVGDDTLFGGAESDTLWGGDGIDILYDAGGRSSMFGDWGNDILVGSVDAIRANSLYDGGDGADIFTAGTIKSTGVIVSLVAGTDGAGNSFATAGVKLAGQGSGARLVAIENVEGTINADDLTGDAAANTLSGLAGNDRLYGLDGVDYIHGGGGNDSLYGGADHDLLVGAEGDDLLVGGEGADTFAFEGAFGRDTLTTRTGASDLSEYGGDVLLFNDVSFTDLVFVDTRQSGDPVAKGDLIIQVIDRNDPSSTSRCVTVKDFDSVSSTAGIVVAANTDNGQRALISAIAIMALASAMADAGLTSSEAVMDSPDQHANIARNYWLFPQAA